MSAPVQPMPNPQRTSNNQEHRTVINVNGVPGYEIKSENTQVPPPTYQGYDNGRSFQSYSLHSIYVLKALLAQEMFTQAINGTLPTLSAALV